MIMGLLSCPKGRDSNTNGFFMTEQQKYTTAIDIREVKEDFESRHFHTFTHTRSKPPSVFIPESKIRVISQLPTPFPAVTSPD
jgi:hypothetical protein